MVNLYFADGFEEIEALTVFDILKRAEIEVNTVSIMEQKQIEGAHGLKLYADFLFDDVNHEECEMIILPGGMPGAKYLSEHKGLIEMITKFNESGKWVAAICASPAFVLNGNRLIDGKNATCFPALKGKMEGSNYTEQKVVVDGKLITSQGPATAMNFAMEIVRQIKGEEAYKDVAAGLLFEG